jgi:hypothetical protein
MTQIFRSESTVIEARVTAQAESVAALFAESWRGFAARLDEQLRPIFDHAATLVKSVHDSFQARLEIYPSLAEQIIPLAQRGWFISGYFGLSEIDKLAMSARTLSLEDLEKCVARLYDEDLTDHLGSMIHDHPEREFVIRPAVNAHLRKEYALSIMAFFSQIDGICFHATDRYVFLGGDDKHISTLAVNRLQAIGQSGEDNIFEEFFAVVSEIMWSSISGRLPVSYNERERRDQKYRGLNRHTVLHGIAMKENATKENSLKAFSFLSYMASLAESDGHRDSV